MILNMNGFCLELHVKRCVFLVFCAFVAKKTATKSQSHKESLILNATLFNT